MDDFVISAIRAVKQKLKVAKNNTLMVCPSCMEPYAKKRGEYEKRLVQHTVIAALLLAIFIFLPIFTSGFSLWSVLMGLVTAAIVLGLSVVSHCPKIEGLDAAARPAGAPSPHSSAHGASPDSGKKGGNGAKNKGGRKK